MTPTWRNYCSLLVILLAHHVIHTRSLGVCFGTLGDDLPSAVDVVSLYKQHDITKMRLYNPNPVVQDALRDSGIDLALGVSNDDLQNLAGSLDAASAWVTTNIVPYSNVLFQYVTVGNEAIPGENAQYIAPAMKNLRDALNSLNYQGIKVTTVVASNVLGTSYPPSQGAFSNESVDDITAIVSLLANLGPENPDQVLMVNVYPYFAYVADPDHVSLEYAQFSSQDPVFKDGDLEYWFLFDAMVDAFYSAMEKVGGANVGIAISESGWPSAGNGNFTTPDLAQRYNVNFIGHIARSGTPKRPNQIMDGFVFAMFNENQKPAGVEQNFGLFYPSGQPVYPITS